MEGCARYAGSSTAHDTSQNHLKGIYTAMIVIRNYNEKRKNKTFHL